MSEQQDALILQTHGVEEPNRTYAPLFYAMTAAAMEVDTSMWFTMNGTSQLGKGEAEKVQIDEDSDVTLRTMLDRAINSGVTITVCHQSMDLFGYEEDDLIEEAEIVGAASIIDKAMDADLVLYF